MALRATNTLAHALPSSGSAQLHSTESMVVYRRSGVRIADLFFGEPRTNEPEADLIRYNYWPVPLDCGYRRDPHFTRVIDLTLTEDELLANLRPTPRRHIRQAQREHFEYDFQFPATSEAILRFCEFYNTFNFLKRVAPADRERTLALARAERLEINRVVDQGVTVVSHLYVRMLRRVVLLHSCSAFENETTPAGRNRIAFANRYLHWQEFQRWKRQGVEVCDFGGWYIGQRDHKLLAINRFKEGFGGKVEPSYNAIAACSLRGRLALEYLRLRDLIGTSAWSRGHTHEYHDVVKTA